MRWPQKRSAVRHFDRYFSYVAADDVPEAQIRQLIARSRQDDTAFASQLDALAKRNAVRLIDYLLVRAHDFGTAQAADMVRALARNDPRFAKQR
jgi:hypothetical protein